jgi:hypothetical protein
MRNGARPGTNTPLQCVPFTTSSQPGAARAQQTMDTLHFAVPAKQEVAMNRIKPSHAFALPLALLLGFATPSAPALAGWQQDGATYTYPNGEKTTWYQDTNDPDKYCIYWEHNGLVTLVFLDFGKSDPGPDDASGKGTEKPDIAELIKLDKSGKGYTVTLAPENTKLSKWITGGGFGFGPHGNPGDQDSGTGPGKTPVH